MNTGGSVDTHKSWVTLFCHSIDEKMHKFWMQADFGYIKHIKDNLKTVCEPQDKVNRIILFKKYYGMKSFYCS